MSPFASVLSIFALAIAAQASSDIVETLAQPVSRPLPAYPAECAVLQHSASIQHQVKVAFDVTSKGEPELVRVVETTNACFNNAAVAAVEGWKFEPRRINGDARPQTGLTSTIAFTLDEQTLKEIETRPLDRDPPTYPKRCIDRAQEIEFVTIRFDISVAGSTENIVVIDSTNACFEQAAVNAIEQWRYIPAVAARNRSARSGIEETITFQTE